MVCSPARSTAKTENPAPKDAESKVRARRDYLQSLTGQDYALPNEDPAEVARRRAALFHELAPKSEVGRMLVGRLAFLGLRLERCQRNDVAAYSQKVRYAEETYHEGRCAKVDGYAAELDNNPGYACRCLQKMPEGIDWLIFHIRMLRDDLVIEDREVWCSRHSWQLLTYLGIKPNTRPRMTRVTVLTEAVQGFFANLDPGGHEGLTDPEKVQWARRELLAIIDEEIERLQGVRATLDHEMIRRDREESKHRALFDPSPDSILARKYEAATERSLYRALREFKALDESEIAEEPDEVAPEPAPGPPVSTEPESQVRGQLAAYFQTTLAPAEIEPAVASFPAPVAGAVEARSTARQDRRAKRNRSRKR